MGASPEVLDPAHRLHRKLGAGHCGDFANLCASSIEEDITSQLVSGLEDGSGDRGIRRLQTDHAVAQKIDPKAFGFLSKSNQNGLGVNPTVFRRMAGKRCVVGPYRRELCVKDGYIQ